MCLPEKLGDIAHRRSQRCKARTGRSEKPDSALLVHNGYASIGHVRFELSAACSRVSGSIRPPRQVRCPYDGLFSFAPVRRSEWLPGPPAGNGWRVCHGPGADDAFADTRHRSWLVPKVAVATSFAAMVPVACSAVFAQYRRGALDLQWVWRLTPAAAIGAVIGSEAGGRRQRSLGGHGVRVYTPSLPEDCCADRIDSMAGGARIVGALPVPLVGALIGTLLRSLASAAPASPSRSFYRRGSR